MEKPDTLYQLIGAMSKAEKRYFRLWAGRTEGKKNYMLLWEAIEKLPEPSDTALKQKYSRAAWMTRLPYEKNYLYHQLLSCLRVFHEDLTPEVSMYNRLLEVKILHEKGLHDCSRKMLEKCLVTAQKEQYTMLELEMLKMKELNDDVRQDFPAIKKDLSTRLSYKKTLVREVGEKIWVEYLYDHFLLSIKQKNMPDFDNLIRKLEPVIVRLEDRHIRSRKVHQLRCHLMSMWYLMKDDIEKSTLWLEKMLDVLEKNPTMLATNVRAYLSSLSNIAGRYIILQKRAEFYETIHKIRNASQVFPLQKDQKRINFALASSIQLEVLYHVFNNTFPELKYKIRELEKLWNQAEADTGKEQHITHYLTMGAYFMLTREYKDALKYLSYLFNKDIPEGMRPDLKIFGRFLRVLIALEREDEKGWEIRRRELKKHLRESTYSNKTLEMLIELLDHTYDKDGITFSPGRWKQINEQVTEWIEQRKEDKPMFTSAGIMTWFKEIAEKK